MLASNRSEPFFASDLVKVSFITDRLYFSLKECMENKDWAQNITLNNIE